MLISVVNFSKIADDEIQKVLRAVNRQIEEDFAPHWHIGGSLRLEGRIATSPKKHAQPDELRGEAILYLWDKEDLRDALGYHDANYLGLPFGFVFTHLAQELGEPWSVTLSHEALELLGDAHVNGFAAGPHPQDRNRLVFHWFEMCDAVQAEMYEIDHVKVSNFLLPLYFTVGNERGGRNDFLGTQRNGKGLQSFGVNPGGYIGFFDPTTGQSDTYVAPGDQKAQKRLAIKGRAQVGRRAVRYREFRVGGAWRMLNTEPLRAARCVREEDGTSRVVFAGGGKGRPLRADGTGRTGRPRRSGRESAAAPDGKSAAAARARPQRKTRPRRPPAGRKRR